LRALHHGDTCALYFLNGFPHIVGTQIHSPCLKRQDEQDSQDWGFSTASIEAVEKTESADAIV